MIPKFNEWAFHYVERNQPPIWVLLLIVELYENSKEIINCDNVPLYQETNNIPKYFGLIIAMSLLHQKCTAWY
jgi:hypothetical protein